MGKGRKYCYNKIMDKIQEKLSTKIVGDFFTHLSSSIKKEDYSVFYSNGGRLLSIITVIPKDNEGIENKIYSNEAKILKKYSDNDDVDIDFRVMPRYKEPLRNFIPSSFKRYANA